MYTYTMLAFVFLIGLDMCYVVVSHSLYEPVRNRYTYSMSAGLATDINGLLNRCETNLKDKRQKSLELSKSLEITTTALFYLQKKIYLSGTNLLCTKTE